MSGSVAAFREATDWLERRTVEQRDGQRMRSRKNPFKGRQFTSEVILWAVRWYLQFPISYRDLELMLRDRGVSVDHTTIYRWIQAYAVELEKRLRPHLRPTNGSWRVNETYIKVKGRWVYLYKAVDSRGQTIDFRLSARRDAQAAKRFFRKALARPNTVEFIPLKPLAATGSGGPGSYAGHSRFPSRHPGRPASTGGSGP